MHGAAQDFLLAAELAPGAISSLSDSGGTAKDVDAMLARGYELVLRAGDPVVPRVNLMAIDALVQAQQGRYDAAYTLAEDAVALAGDPALPGSQAMVSLALAVAMTLRPSSLSLEEVEAGLRRVLAMGDGTEV